MKGNISLGDFINDVKMELVNAQKDAVNPFYELKEVNLEVSFVLDTSGKLNVVAVGSEMKASQTHKVTLRLEPIKKPVIRKEKDSQNESLPRFKFELLRYTKYRRSLNMTNFQTTSQATATPSPPSDEQQTDTGPLYIMVPPALTGPRYKIGRKLKLRGKSDSLYGKVSKCRKTTTTRKGRPDIRKK